MSHQAQIDYCLWVKNKFPEFFKNTRVVDFGSLDINGSNRRFFDDCEYTGLDIGAGNNVDIVTRAHEYHAPDAHYDVVVSTEMFEHDKYLHLSLPNMVRVLRPGGLFFWTCATTGRHEHGTRRTEPSASPFTSQAGDGWDDFYENVDQAKVRQILDIDALFSEHAFDVLGCDIRFYGIKK
jgi:SAM-dependent methyltransferase